MPPVKSPVIGLGLGAALVLGGALVAYRWLLASKSSSPPTAALASAKSFAEARLTKNCALAWSLLSEDKRALGDEHQFCAELGQGCARPLVEVTSSAVVTGGFTVTGRSRCEGRVWAPFVLTLVRVDDSRWAVSEIADGY